MKKIYSFIISLSIISTLNSQTYQWAFNAGNTAYDEGASVQTDNSGNIYVIGRFSGTNVDFDPGVGVADLNSNGGSDVFVAKYNPSGQYQWAFNIGGASADRGMAIAVDGSGNVYITGWFFGTNIDFDPGAGIANVSSLGSEDVFVAKYNTNGLYQWAFNIGASTNLDRGYGICVDVASNVYVTGCMGGANIDFDPGAGSALLSTNGGEDIFLAKYNSTGAYQWAFNLGGAGNFSEYGFGVSCDASSNVYITGQTSLANVDFDPSVSVANVNSASTNIFLAKYNTAGQYQWAFGLGGNNYDVGISLSSDASGNIVLTGVFQGSNIDFDPGVGVSTISSNANSIDIFVARYNTLGQYQWAFPIGGSTNTEYGSAVKWSPAGDVLVTGFFSGTADFDPGAPVVNLSPSAQNVYAASYNSNGQYQFAFNIGVAAPSEGYGICSDNNNSIIVTGFFTGNVIDFNPAVGTNTLSSLGSADIFIAKYANCVSAPLQPTSINGLTSLCTGVGATSYSIATVVGATSYSWSLPGGWSGTSTSNSISATPGSSGTISVTASNTCGTSAAQNLSVTINALPTIVYTQNPDTVCANAGNIALGSVTPIGGTFSGTAVSGTNFNATTAGAGTFTITYTYTDGNSCTNTASQNILVDLCTGLSDQTLAESNLIVFPNPANELVTITTNENKGQLIIYNTLGAVLYSKQLNATQTTVDVSAYQSGIYFIQLQTVDGMATKKIIKQ